jgi:hypothetical protein
LSGDDALNVQYDNMNGGGTTNWVSPSLDGGTLNPQPVASDWSVVTALHYTTAADNQTSSTVEDSKGLELQIVSTLSGSNVNLALTFTNYTGADITNLLLADYFNFHPNGSTTGFNKGTTSYGATCAPLTADCITTVGQPGGDFLFNASMGGSAVSTYHTVGSVSTVVGEVSNNNLAGNGGTNAYDGASGPVGPGDNAGALAWNLGTLRDDASETFDIGKDVPEPGAWYLVAGAVLALAGRRRAWKRG